MIDPLQLDILGPALLAGLLVLATHVPLGQEVLRRGIIFIDLALAQIAGLGVIAAHTLGLESHPWGVQLFAGGSALLGAWLLGWTERHWQEGQEALIGVVFVLAASGGILLLANNPHGSEHLQELLSGQILWADSGQLVWIAGLYGALMLLWWRFPSVVGGRAFYMVFAVAVTSSVQLVGVYLVFSSLIIPALVTQRLALSKGKRLMAGYLMGAAGYLAGLASSTWLDLPSGPSIVWCLAMVGLTAVLLGGRKERVI
ncbi:MAG: metal ABC transporter permease [bacterium]